MYLIYPIQKNRWLVAVIALVLYVDVHAQPTIIQDKAQSSIVIKDKKANLVLNLSYKNRCAVSDIKVMNQQVVSHDAGIFSAVKIGDKWHTTAEDITQPTVAIAGDKLTITNISFGDKSNPIKEKWIFKTYDDYIDFTIERTYPGRMVLEDTGFPQWSFDKMQTWTGALLGTGGVAWCKLFDKQNASLANHTGEVALWNQENNAGLSVKPVSTNGQQVAVRFSRQPDDKWTLNYTAAEQRTNTRHTLSRFIINRQDIWDTLTVKGTAVVTYRLRAFDYDKEYYRGKFPGFNGASIRSVENTIARVGVIDENIMGSNNWHVGEGYAVLHEQWIAQMGIGINDSNYLKNYQKTIDYYRDNAISAEGRVKSRWAYNSNDAEPGTYDSKGFYEAQWGKLLDANTDQVINVAELFQLNGNLAWVRTHKESCEKVLAYLLKRDSDNDGLIEAMTDSYTEKRGSDWIDVIWASYENAFLNAEMYEALVQWAEVENLLGDQKRATEYLSIAARLKARFNLPIKEGGFWDPEKQWYVYWRDKDDRIHGSNLVTPVNFMAIAYGICDDASRQKAILDKTEELMKKENLFMWPISFFPYEPDEGYKVNYPFPNYENGDIFLGWGELGVRAYQLYNPAIPIQYIKNVLAQYEKDGLAFQRYDRKEGKGQGSDILANNSLSVVGLYRNIYGIKPKYNRLYLQPHLTPELNGTEIKYWLRGLNYMIKLSMGDYRITANSFAVHSALDFGMNTSNNSLEVFKGDSVAPAMKITRDKNVQVTVKVNSWQDERNMEINPAGAKLSVEIYDLKPVSGFEILQDGKSLMKAKSDTKGRVSFNITGTKDLKLQLKPA